MKTNQTKTKAAEPAKKSAPFFNKEAGQSYFQPIQAKLTVNEPGDPLEKEADKMADHVVQKMDKQSVSRKPIFESKNEAADGGVQRKASGGGAAASGAASGAASAAGGGVPASVQHGLAASKGGGSPLPEGTRHEMENTMGSDLSGVRLHNDGKANQMSKDLGAQAFTHGKDIYFNNGKYSPGSKEGKHLLAHELTHTVQQDTVRRTPSIQKQDGASAGGGAPTPPATGSGASGSGSPRLELPGTILLPAFKGERANIEKPVEADMKYKRKDPKTWAGQNAGKPQIDIWKAEVKPEVQNKLTKLAEKAKLDGAMKEDQQTHEQYYYFKHNKVSLIGTLQSITSGLVIPTWSKSGLASAYDVDHKKELQLGGHNVVSNMELLNFSANRSSGSKISYEITNKIIQGLDTLKKNKKAGDPDVPTYAKAKKQGYVASFKDVKYEMEFDKGPLAQDYWSKEEIEKGSPLDNFAPMKPAEVKEASGEKVPMIYTSGIGGTGMSEARMAKLPGLKDAKFRPEPNGDLAGFLDTTLEFPKAVQAKNPVPIPIFRIPGVINGGSIPRQGNKKSLGLEQLLGKVDFTGLSPVDIGDLTLGDKGLGITGTIHPSLDILEGVDIDFFIQGKDFGVSTTITADDIKAPSPFSITSALLTVGAGTNGVYVEGIAQFEISGLGQGQIKGKGKSDGSFGIDGYFEFDKKLAKNGARIDVSYDNKLGWGIKGKIGLGDNIKGIKSGEIIVSYADKVFTATGTAKTSIEGINDVALRIKVAPDVTQIEGDVTVAKLPGIKSGEGHLQITKIADNYSFSGSGKIIPDIPKLSSEIDFSFHDDIFMVDVTLDYVNERLTGKLHIGITNTDVDDEGKPTGKSKGKFTVYGGGQMSLKITDDIVATAGVNLLPDGEIEMKGGITLPGKFQVVPPLLQIVDKDIISFPEISIPLFGIPLGVTTIGLEATIDPKLTANVQLGPGYLTNVGAEIDYNPSQPENLSITGAADFEFIASAGITAGVDFAVGLSVGIASIKGGVNLSAYINAEAEQPVFHTDIKYSPKTGFELNGDVKAMVKAILGFKGTLFVEGSAGVWPLKVHKRWEHELFKKDIDTGLEIGFEFPFGYKDGKANVSWENLKFKYPTFDEGFLHRVKAAIIDPVKREIFGDDDD